MILRDLTTLADFRRVVELEREVWGVTYADVVPVPILVVTVKRGGILIGAFDDRDELVGFVYSLPGIKHGRPMQWSHMLGVVGQHRRGGLGHQLKLAQRQRALAMGLDLIEWTFDPLQAVNAHLNFNKLGVLVREYEENVYGESASPLHRGTATDRLVAEWWIRDPRVDERLAGRGTPVDRLASAAAVNTTRPCGQWRECVAHDLAAARSEVSVEIPTGFSEMQQQAPEMARAWRTATREIFTTYFSRGYRAVGFLLDADGGRYLLERQP